MTEIDRRDVYLTSEGLEMAALGELNKMELLAVCLERFDVPYDTEILEDNECVRSDYLRAILYSIVLDELDHPKDIQQVKELMEVNAPIDNDD